MGCGNGPSGLSTRFERANRLRDNRGKAVRKTKWRSGRTRQNKRGFSKLWKGCLGQLPNPVGNCTLRQGTYSEPRRDGRPNASDAFACADDLVVQMCCFQQIEAAFPPPTLSIKECHRQRTTVLDLMESRPGPNGGFTVNDNIVSRDTLGSMQRDIQFVSRER